MKAIRIFPAVASLVCLFLSSAAYAVNDPNAAVIQLRLPANGGCVEAGVTLNNCVAASHGVFFDQLSGASSFVVEIGPGTFGQMLCSYNGISNSRKISIRGAGIDTTTLASLTLLSACANVSFTDMTIGGTGIGYAVAVVNSGTNTTWTNVKLAGSWQEYCASTSGGTGRHNWFGSQIVATLNGSAGYYEVKCDESWFYGSEITAKGNLASGDVVPFRVTGRELHVYGSVIRALGTGATASYALGAVSATGGKVHIHGTGIDVIAVNGAPANITVLSAANGAEIHADASAYNLSTGTGGAVTRILKDTNPNSHVHAPYQWQHIPSYPFTSVTGADITTVTTGTSDGQPHLTVYSTSCPSGWYDTSDKVCRP
jgi:hypothetical protein